MSKSNSRWNAVAIGAVSVLLGVIAFAFSQSIFNLFFVAFIVAVLWEYTDKVKRLEQKLSRVEARMFVDQASGTQEHLNSSDSS